MKAQRISRRTLLRGAGIGGIGIGLPLLEVMARPPRRARAQAVAERFVLFHLNNGVEMTDWLSGANGASWTLSAQQQPLAAHHDALNLVTGLSAIAGAATTGGFGSPHAVPTLSFLTARPVHTDDGATGASIEKHHRVR